MKLAFPFLVYYLFVVIIKTNHLELHVHELINQPTKSEYHAFKFG